MPGASPRRVRSADPEPTGRRRSMLDSSNGWPAAVPLSPRECEIVRLVARDLSNKQIAAVLDSSIWTVSTHLRRVFAKLGVHSKAAMVARVMEMVTEWNRGERRRLDGGA